MTPDQLNALFEFVGSAFTWMNVRRVVEDKGYAGIYLPAIAFFFAWGFWNLFYYPSLGQWWSFLGGLSLVLANLSWVMVMLRFGKLSSQPNTSSSALLPPSVERPTSSPYVVVVGRENWEIPLSYRVSREAPQAGTEVGQSPTQSLG